MGRRYTYKDVKTIVEEAGYELLSTENEIVNNKGFVLTTTKIKTRCQNTEHDVYETTLGCFSIGRRCKKCVEKQNAEDKKYTYQQVKEYIRNCKSELLSDEYINNKTPLRIRCSEGHEYHVSFNNFKNKESRCPYCNGNAKYTYEEVKEYIELFGYELLSNEYLGAKEHLKLKCPKGHEWDTVSFNSFLRGNRCKKCANEKLGEDKKYSYKYIKEYIESFGYELLSEQYMGANEYIIVKPSCEHEPYKVTFSHFKRGNRCPKCKESKGEKEITNILNKYNIKHFSQYKFDECKLQRQLPFDFYLPNYNLCIEYDGQQHFEMVEWFGGLDGFIKTKIRDTIKNEYCKKNNIKLIRIPYWEFDNIENIIVNELNLE